MINWKTCNPLTDEQLHDTACLAKQGDRNAIELLVSSNVKLASSLAHQYSTFDGMNIEDLTSEAIIGLIESIPLYDPNRGTKFTTFASWRMRMHVLNFVLDNFRLVKIGTTQAQRKIFWRLNRETEALRKAGIDPTDQILAARLQVKAQEVNEMQIRMTNGEASLDATNPGNPNGGTLIDTMPNSTPNPEQYVTKKRMISWMQARMVEFEQRLTGNDLQVWNYRIAADAPLTVQATGDLIGTSKQYVNQIEIRLQAQFAKFARKQAKV